MKKYVITSIVIILVVMFVPIFWLKLFQLTFGIDDGATLLIVAAIGLVGAILGGVISGGITLLGVTRTIEHTQTVENKRRLRDELMSLNPLLREIEEIKENLLFDIYENHTGNEELIRQMYKKISSEKQLFDYAQRGSFVVYSELISYRRSVDYMMEKIYHFDEIDHDADETLINGLRDIEEIIKQEIESKLKMVNE